MHTTTTTPTGIMLRLREATGELHTRAERSEFQQRLVRGGITREHYGAWLAQLFLVHRELESRLQGYVAARPSLAAFVREELYQTPRLRDDLAFLGIAESSVVATPATRQIIEQVREAATNSPVALLGFYYVLEGSKNGSRFIAKAVRRTLNIAPGQGDRYLDPHGDDQPRLWGAFKQGMDGVSFSESESAAMVSAACRMFEAAEGIGSDLL